MHELTIECNVPRCSNPSIFTTHGMVGGHYWPMCVDHAHEWLARHIARLARLSEALDALPHAAQLTLVEARDRVEP